MFYHKPVIFFLLIFLWVKPVVAQNYIFAQLTGSPVNTTGWNLQGAATIGNIVSNDRSEIIVCPVNGASGAIFYNQPINLSLCNKWKAEFDFRMHDGTGADGLAFCFLDVPPSGFVSGGGLGIPSTANGLKVCFDTWNNCNVSNSSNVHENMPKVEIRWGAGYDECAGTPTKNNADGTLSFIADNTYKHAKITYESGTINVYVNDVLYLTGFQQFNYAGYLGFTASTGGYNDNHSIRNVIIYTEMPPSEAGLASGVCPNNAAQLGTTNNPNYVYEWSPAAGLSATNISNPLAQIENTTTHSQNHTYYVKTSFKNNPGCSSIDSVSVKVLPRPTVNFLMPAICLNDAVAAFKDSSYTLESSLLPFTWQWNFGDPNASPANPNTATIANPSHRYSAAANYNVQLTVKNNAGCSDSLNKVFTVNGAVPAASFTINNTGALCSNKQVQITDASTVDFGKVTKVEIMWGDTANQLQTDNQPAQGKIYTHGYPANPTTTAVNYTIRYKVYSGITCMNEVTKTISILTSPQVAFAAVPSVCANATPFTISQATETTGLPGAFVFTGSGISASGSFDPARAGAGTHNLSAKFIATNTCVDSASQNILTWPVPTANTGPDLYMLQGGRITIPATASGDNLSYLWSPAAYLNNNKVLQPVASPVADIQYVLKVTGTGNCEITDSLRITVLKDPAIPTAFSPNNDGINDKWMIKYLDTYPGCTVDIFDRYGSQVFHSTGYNTPWDGTHNSKPVPVGVYYYMVNTKKHDRPFTGSVTVIR